MQTAGVAGADRVLGTPFPLILQFTVKATRERQTRVVERIRLEGPAVLLMEQGMGSESVLLDSIEDLAITRNPALRRPDGTP